MRSKLALGFPIFLASLSMRAGLVMVGPLIPILKEYFNLSNTSVSLLAGIPIICFAGSSILMKLVSKIGSSNQIIRWAITSLSVALIARAFTGLAGLFIFTFLMGISIAVMNYEIPAWVKSHAPSDAGLMTGIYVTLMGVAGSLSVAISVPLAQINSLSWRLAMIPWMVVASLTSIYWWTKRDHEGPRKVNEQVFFWNSKAFRSPVAWSLALFFGFESMSFYSTATWFPTILTTKDFTLRQAALAVSISGLIGSIVSIAVPHWIQKIKDQRFVITAVALVTGVSFLMIALQSGPILFLWLTLSNIGISISCPIALLLAGSKSDSPEATRNLSTMFQSVGYVISATGPFLIGQLFDLTNSWNTAMYGVVAMVAIQIVFGLIVGKPSKVDY